MAHRSDFRQWPFLTQDEFELACAFFDQKYVNAKLGPTRKIFKLHVRRALSTGASYVEILRMLQLPEEDNDLSLALARLGGGEDDKPGMDVDTMAVDEDADQVGDSFSMPVNRMALT